MWDTKKRQWVLSPKVTMAVIYFYTKETPNFTDLILLSLVRIFFSRMSSYLIYIINYKMKPINCDKKINCVLA